MKAIGFSLLDVLISLSILTILIGIGVRNLDCLVDNAHKSEAIANLGAIYQAEQTHFNEFNTYTMCILKIGFMPDGSRRVYSVGFGPDANSGACGAGTEACNRYEQNKICNTLNAKYGDPVDTSDINVAATTTSGIDGIPMSFAAMGGTGYTCHGPGGGSGLVFINGVPFNCWGYVGKRLFQAVAYRGVSYKGQPAIQGYLVDQSKKVLKAKYDGYP